MGQVFDSVSEACISQSVKICPKDKDDKPEDVHQTLQDDADDTLISLETTEANGGFPENIIDVKVKTSNLILKRNSNPWENYNEVCDLGSGTFGQVKKVMLKTARIFRAMKIIPKCRILEGLDDSTVNREINILRNLDHPNIMKIYEFYEDQENFYLISEYCDQGDLLGKMEKLKSMPEVMVKFLMSQILNAVAYLHSKKVLHGDIKMENILLYSSASRQNQKRFTVLSQDIRVESFQREVNESFRNRIFSKRTKNYIDNITNYEIKLIDFGCSKIFSKKNHKNLSGIIGTSIYCSPEVVDDFYDEKSDEWSCGVLLYLLLCGEPPFQGETEEEIFAKIKKGKYSMNLTELKRASKNCRDLVTKLLAYNKKDRISANEALRHPFFTESFNPEGALTANKDLSLLRELAHVKPINKFQEAILAYLALNLVDKTEEKKIREVFRYLDKKANNELSFEEICDGLKENGYVLSENEYKIIFKNLDSDQNGKISYQEFLRVMCDKNELLSDRNLEIAFKWFDVSEKNEITWNDINSIIFQGKHISDEVIDEYLTEVGMKRDKGMNFEEFKKLMQNLKETKDK